MAALSSKSRNDRNFKISPVLIYYYPIASIALLILLRAVLKSKFLRSSGAKTSNNSVSIREFISLISSSDLPRFFLYLPKSCLLYTSDAADEEDSVDLGGRRIIKKKKKIKK